MNRTALMLAANLALALRAEAALAPTVLDLIAGRSEPVLALVRGDANRIVGHEAEALRDYVSVAEWSGWSSSSITSALPLNTSTWARRTVVTFSGS